MKFPSKYSNGKDVSAAQFITELICENKAKIDKRDLHFKFWNNKEWASFFRNQIASANKLLKNYDAVDIIRALKTPKGQKIYSLRAKHLIPMIIEQQVKSQSMVDASKSINIDRSETKKIKEHKISKNILSRLEDLDNE
jgi:hypothetical protein